MVKRFTKIQGLSDIRRLPRLGIIKLGTKEISEKSGKEYPKESPFFVCPPEVKAIFGDEPTDIDVMFPMADREIIFPQSYRYYGSGKGLKCEGDEVNASRKNEQTGEWEDFDCATCPLRLEQDGKAAVCKPRAFLQVIIPRVSVGGVYQISTTSRTTIVNINSGLDYVQTVVGRVQMVPLTLRRRPMETHHGGQKQTHYDMQVIFNFGTDFINQLRLNNEQILTGPKYLPPAPVDSQAEGDDTVPADIKDEEKPVQVSTPPAVAVTTPDTAKVSTNMSPEQVKAIMNAPDPMNDMDPAKQAQFDKFYAYIKKAGLEKYLPGIKFLAEDDYDIADFDHLTVAQIAELGNDIYKKLQKDKDGYIALLNDMNKGAAEQAAKIAARKK